MSYTCNNPKELKDAVLRRLGAPIVNVEVTTEQVYDCIQRAIELYGEYHYEGLNKSYMTVMLTEEQAKNGLVVLPNSHSVFAVTKLLRYSKGCLGSFGGTPYTWFTDFINGMASGAGNVNQYGPMAGIGGMGVYTQLMGYMNMMRDILDPIPDYWFNSVNGQLRLFGNFSAGHTIIMEVFVKSFVDLDSSHAVAGAKGFTAGKAGACTTGDGVTELDVYNDPFRQMTRDFRAGSSNGEYMNQNVYNVRWVKDFTTSLVKELNGTILAKHQGMQLPGGVTVDGVRLIQEAREEIENLRDELYGLEEPLPIILG